MMDRYPVFGICGYSGSGKTTLIEPVIRELCRRGLKVGVVKHDVHGLSLDHEGKDTDRFFKAGADVLTRGAAQTFYRAHGSGDLSLDALLKLVGPYYDLIIAEGYKTTPIPHKVWLCGDDGAPPPPETTGVQRVLRREDDRFRIVMALIDAWLPGLWCKAPVHAGILIGGKSSRFGAPKHLQMADGRTWLERTVEKVRSHVDGVAVLGAGELPASLRSLPVLCDVPGSKGPLAGMLAATRWMPLSSWIFLPCDLPLLSSDAVRWLLEHRRPGAWAVLPQLPDTPSPEPLLAYYDFRSAPLLEHVRRPLDMAAADHVSMPVVPQCFHASWNNVNTGEDLAAVTATDAAVGRRRKRMELG